MPDSLLQSGSEFDASKALLWRWLNENVAISSTLGEVELRSYTERSFVAGWEVAIVEDGEPFKLHVLIDGQYPYSPLRIAYKSKDAYLKWPHVEPQGLLCLPSRSAPLTDVTGSAHRSLVDSLDLIKSCQREEFVTQELRREFVSYWQRLAHQDAVPVRSLLNVENGSPRIIAVWFGKNFTLVGETAEQVMSWLNNRGDIKPQSIVAGAYGLLDEPPIPKFPDRSAELFDHLKNHCPDLMDLVERLSVSEPLAVVLGARAESGIGLIGFKINSPSLNGFRKEKINSRPSDKLALWKARGALKRLKVIRCDPAWVHGRGKNPHSGMMQNANVLVLGCGSLGSQVATRLAQAGIGSLTIVDPDTVTAANVGRHALGLDDLGESKAKALARALRKRLPHLRIVQEYYCSWQQLYEKSPTTFTSASLIVACLGEWSADGQLGEWQTRTGLKTPIVYGWLDERGSAAHALSMANGGVPLSCILGPDGSLRDPETIWTEEVRLETEPACGTLFQPYGAVDVAFAEALVSKLALDVLAERAPPTIHRVYACSTTQLTESGGAWSQHHLQHRPAGHNGAFEYERQVSRCGHCASCKAQS